MPEPALDPHPNGTANGAQALDARADQERLLEIVSERTGYPVDMLEIDADLEGDLGIDSIKRVEIAGSFTQSLDEQERAAIDLEELTASRTLTAVIDTLEAAIATAPPPAAPAAVAAGGDTRPFEQGPAEEERIGRFVVQVASAPAITSVAGLAGAGAVVIIDDEIGVAEELAGAFSARGEPVIRISREQQPRDAEQAAQFAADIRDRGGAKALIHLGALGDGRPGGEGLGTLMLLAQALRPDLEAASVLGGAVILGATRLGGPSASTGALPSVRRPKERLRAS